MKYNNFDEIVKFTMAFLEDDYTELWLIVNKIKDENPQLSFKELIEATKEIVSFISLSNNLVLINETTKLPQSISKTEIQNIVEEHLTKLNKIPNIGDGIWLSIEKKTNRA